MPKRVQMTRRKGGWRKDHPAAVIDAIKAFDLPVTRLMTLKQMTAFMDEVHRLWTSEGVRLTDPEALKYEDEFQ